jgi:uncharacterized protein
MFEYDPKKNDMNIAKHGLSFETAKEVFSDPFRVITDVTQIGQGEVREMTIGMISLYEIIIAVVHTDRCGVTRLISARKAQPKEKRLYEETKQRQGG